MGEAQWAEGRMLLTGLLSAFVYVVDFNAEALIVEVCTSPGAFQGAVCEGKVGAT
jgi:hypothetical protein